mmetsp:Transcript_10417/g.26728  ORF Transcript_10417/g.26728 Transcript_10417/m.26728 type:complete len:688 (-) Transcript_10417:38-2101(-)|eukprot:CAMPEP_0182918048 /NCGR_PEP_ID=MMETSP0105_2-20130417/1853_1 /TAXON_ID=81532 ORGANISM="Acanthoeca-like sp., Strain 10tr" /NCGR_SAMPLE_ID=MMETSP0105_2 /ASSEMBLY_ACC=CAM_ASM_000205 /LENGTH=687 /DNA_ID=CAMNT_0025055079 /DNA_START=59 /DNA_END=2122 /DNA_ORIENTATION=-
MGMDRCAAMATAVGAAAVLTRTYLSKYGGAADSINFNSPVISLGPLDLLVVGLAAIAYYTFTKPRVRETAAVRTETEKTDLAVDGFGAAGGDDSTYGTNSTAGPKRAPLRLSSESLKEAIAEAKGNPVTGSTSLGSSDIDCVINDLSDIQRATADGPGKDRLSSAIHRLKEVVASDDFNSPRFATVDSEDRSIIQYITSHGAQIKPRRGSTTVRRRNSLTRPLRDRLRCRSLVDLRDDDSGNQDDAGAEADDFVLPLASALRTCSERAAEIEDLRKGLEDSQPEGSLRVQLRATRAAAAASAATPDVAPLSSVDTPNWQRGLDHKTVTDDVLASWSFDPFEQCKVSPDQFGADVWNDDSVSGVGYAMQMLSYHGIFDALDLDKHTVKRYLRNIERAYPRNPYHNRIHAIDVMQTCHSVLVHSPHLLVSLDPIEKLALLLGAYIHDVGHPGVNNKLLMRLADDPTNQLHPDFATMAVRYSNHSVCEYYHLATAFEIAAEGNETRSNPFATLSTERFAKLRLLMIELVLATDMEQHFNLIARVKVAVGAGQEEDGVVPPMDLTDPDKKLLMLKAVLHACDISNPAKPTAVCQKWCVAIMEEFYRQGDLEVKADMAPDKMHERCDLTTRYGRVQKANGQLAFIKFIVRPLHEILALQLPIFKEKALACIESNVRSWQRMKEENDGDERAS